MEHIIKYYPVGNADCTLIKLDNGKTIIVDCQMLADLTDGHGKQVMFDVKADLLKELKKDGLGRPFVDLFISTHPHDDHCKGFAGNFYHGEVDDYDKDKNKDKIIIEELWITPRGFNNNLSSPAEDIRKEAKRRRKLYDDDKNFIGSKGNYLRIIGYDKDKEFDRRYCYVPGKLVTTVHGSSLSWLEIFIHAPFKEDVETSKKYDNKNATSVVVQFGFKIDGYTGYKSRVLMVGDDLLADIKGGLNAGVDTCWFNPGNLENKSGITPKYTVSSYEELYRIVMEPEELENIGVRNRRHSNEALL